MSKFSLKISCPSCSSKNTKYYSSLGNLNHLDLYVCFNCELIFKNKGSSLSLLNIEEGDYYLSKKNGSTIDQRHIKHFTRRSKDHLNYITNYFGKNQKKTVLDIGSGSGIFLSYLQKRGWNVKGIEPDPLMQSYSINNLDLDVDKTILSEWVSKKKYNLIYLSHVLDDLPCLKETIDKIYKNLEKGGYLFIEVPNHSWPFRLNFEKVEDLEIGNYFFSIESLRYLIEKNNLTILNMQTFHLVHLNTFYQKLISPFMFLMKLKPEKYRPYLRLIAKK